MLLPLYLLPLCLQSADETAVQNEESVDIQNQHDPLYMKQRQFAHRFDLVIVVTAIFVFVISRASVRTFFFSDTNNLWRIVMVIPLLRLLTLIKTTRSAVYTIFQVIPRFTWLLLILLMFYWIYGVMGVTLFGDALERQLPTNVDYTFKTFPDALIALFQLTVGEGWHDLMYDVMEAENDIITSAVYFVSFVFIITLIFTNLFIGLVISLVDDMETQNRKSKHHSSAHSTAHSATANNNQNLQHQRTRSKLKRTTMSQSAINAQRQSLNSRRRLDEIRSINAQNSRLG